MFFFPLLFSGYCRSTYPCVVSIVSGGCNQSSFTLFYVVFESLYRCVNAVFNAVKSPSSLFPWHIESVNVISGMQGLMHGYKFSYSLIYFWALLWSTSRMVPSILRGGQPRHLSLWQGSCYIVLSRVVFWFFWDTLFKFFLSFPLVGFLFSKRSDDYSIW